MIDNEEHAIAPGGRALTRRAALATGGAAVGAVALAGCAGYVGGSAPAEPEAAAPAAPAGSGASGGKAAPAAGGAALAATSDIPVGGGKIFAAKSVVVTQPTAGEFKAFSTTCTHQGCTVNTVSGGTINCPCHGSKYAIADGSVVGGPAPKPLPAKKVTVSGGSITLA